MNELALFAGAGGGILGGKLLGWRTVCAVEFNAYAASVLVARQNDGCLEPFPIWDDVRSFDGKPWQGIVDIVSGGFPCQDISTARGANRKGLDGEKSGLWREMRRIIDEIRPRFAFVENSPALRTKGLEIVIEDFAAMGFDACWGVYSAADIGARHERQRLWIVACNRYSNCDAEVEVNKVFSWPGVESIRIMPERDVAVSAMDRTSHAMACGMDRLRALGNGQVPAVAALAWCKLGRELLQPALIATGGR